MTHEKYNNEQCSGKQRTAAFRIKSVFGVGYSKGAVLTPEQLDALNTRFGGSEKTKERNNATRNTTRAKAATLPATYINDNRGAILAQVPTTTATQPQTAQKVERKSYEAQILFVLPLVANVVSIALTIAGLWLFAGWYGVALGAMFGVLLFSAIVVSRNAKVGDTSKSALNTVLWMELGACCLHGFTFYTVLPDTNNWLRIGAAVLMAAFVAVLSYNAVLLVRNYNAETNQNENEAIPAT
jgi:energy-converting hydrogenase Eha subunit A